MNIRAASGIRKYRQRNVSPFPSPCWSRSESLRDVLGIRRNPPQHLDLPPGTDWNPSVNLRLVSELRRAYPRTVASHRSPSKPIPERQESLPSSEELIHGPLTRNPVPGGTFRRASSCLQPPKRPLTGRRLAFQLRGTFRQASKPHPNSEEPISSTSTRFPAPWNLPTGIRTTSEPRRTHQQHLNPFFSPVEPFHRYPCEIRTPKSASNTHRPALSAPWNLPSGIKTVSSLRRDL